MSNWTHVAGIVRIDGWVEDDHEMDFDKIFGKECLYESPDEVWRDLDEHPNDYLPFGDEGTLQKTVWINPHPECADRYVVSIFGDLRRHDDPNEIVIWFKQICDNLGYDVRNACIVAQNERNGVASWHHEYK